MVSAQTNQWTLEDDEVSIFSLLQCQDHQAAGQCSVVTLARRICILAWKDRRGEFPWALLPVSDGPDDDSRVLNQSPANALPVTFFLEV